MPSFLNVALNVACLLVKAEPVKFWKLKGGHGGFIGQISSINVSLYVGGRHGYLEELGRQFKLAPTHKWEEYSINYGQFVLIWSIKQEQLNRTQENCVFS